jgi:hypothetical protein
VASLPADGQVALREQCRRLLPAGPIEISATAWAAVAERPADCKVTASPRPDDG